MNELESNLKALIINEYGSMKKFCETINMPWTTLDSILKRGIANSNILNVLKITRELKLDTEKLVDGEIVHINDVPITMAAHLDGKDFTEEQWSRIESFAKFVKQEDSK
ncbi:MAG: hypothetical protein ACI4F1_08765 [Bariatricus sp.]